MAGIVLIAAGLGFLGMGAQPPSPEWGAMVSSGRDYFSINSGSRRCRALAIFMVSLGFNLLGDGLRDVFDPKERSQGVTPACSAGILRMTEAPLLQVEDLHVSYQGRVGPVPAVRGISFALGRERLGIVGESGSGQIDDRPRHPGPPAAQRHGDSKQLRLHDTDLLQCQRARPCATSAAGASRWCCRIRNSRSIPVMTVGRQIAESYRVHTARSPRRRRSARRWRCWKPCASTTRNASIDLYPA